MAVNSLEAGVTTREFLGVNGVFGAIVGEQLGGSLPLPAAVASLVQDGATSQRLPDEAHRWIALLDLCLSPHLFRTGIQKLSPDEETLGEVIRYLVSKKPRGEVDRDRLDWLLTYVFRRRAAAGSSVGFGAVRESIQSWLGSVSAARLSEAAQNLLSEVAAAVTDIADIRSFDQLTESGLIHRGREIKQSFQEEFFHPEVLPALVNYNLVFGRRFNALFSQAAEQAREFAAGIAEKDYHSTGEDFRKLSTAVKEGRPKPAAPPPPSPAEPAPGPPAAAPLPENAIERMKALGVDPSRQEMKLKNVTGDIAGFVRSAGRAVTSIPLPHGALPLNEWESAALSVNYPAEDRSFRAEFSRQVRAAIGFVAAMREELALYHEKRGAEYLWKPHYDALIYLLYHGRLQIVKVEDLAQDSHSRGLIEKADQLSQTAEKLRQGLEEVAQIF